jgi:hypothetical protein
MPDQLVFRPAEEVWTDRAPADGGGDGEADGALGVDHHEPAPPDMQPADPPEGWSRDESGQWRIVGTPEDDWVAPTLPADADAALPAPAFAGRREEPAPPASAPAPYAPAAEASPTGADEPEPQAIAGSWFSPRRKQADEAGPAAESDGTEPDAAAPPSPLPPLTPRRANPNPMPTTGMNLWGQRTTDDS